MIYGYVNENGHGIMFLIQPFIDLRFFFFLTNFQTSKLSVIHLILLESKGLFITFLKHYNIVISPMIIHFSLSPHKIKAIYLLIERVL